MILKESVDEQSFFWIFSELRSPNLRSFLRFFGFFKRNISSSNLLGFGLLWSASASRLFFRALSVNEITFSLNLLFLSSAILLFFPEISFAPKSSIRSISWSLHSRRKLLRRLLDFAGSAMVALLLPN